MSQLASFVLRFLDESGIPHGHAGPGVHEMALPPEVSRELGLRELVRFTDDPEVMQEEPDIELLVPGSPLLDWILTRATRLGRFGQLHVEVRSLDLEACRRKVERELELDRLRLDGVSGGRLSLGTMVELDHLARVTSDVVEDIRLRIFLDARTGLPSQDWAREPPKFVSDQPVYAG